MAWAWYEPDSLQVKHLTFGEQADLYPGLSSLQVSDADAEAVMQGTRSLQSLRPDPSMDTYCAYAWTQVSLKRYSGTKLVDAMPCCNMRNLDSAGIRLGGMAVPNVHELTLEEIFHHPNWNDLRKNLAAGVRDPRCTVCWRQEDLGMKSYRQNRNKDSGPPMTEPKLQEVDVMTSSMCNLRCRMCSPYNSHSMLIDQKYFRENGLEQDVLTSMGRWGQSQAYHGPGLDNPQWQWLMENTHAIKRISASGGEPFYDGKMIDLLKRYIENCDAADTTLHFHTNGSMMSDEMLSILSHFKHNSHDFSVDGSGKVYEYIRYPQDFQSLNDNVLRYVSVIQPHILSLVMVVSALNVLNIADYHAWASGLYHNVYIHFDEIMPTTRGTALDKLPVDLLLEAKQRIESMPKYDHVESRNNINVLKQIDTAIANNRENRQLMLMEIGVFDKSRDQSYRDHLDPLLISWLDSTI